MGAVRAMARWLVCAAGVAATHWPERAEACSCLPYVGSAPGSGATDVPLDVAILLRGGPYLSPDPRYVLRGPSGPVPCSLEQVFWEGPWSMQVLTPLAPLEPGAQYTLEEEWPLFGLTFTTGDSEDAVAPPEPIVGEAWLGTATADSFSSCGGTFNEFQLPLELAGDAIAVELEVTRTADNETRRFIALPDDLGFLSGWDSSCGPSIAMDPGANYEIVARARDLAGNLSGPVTRAASALACPALPSDQCEEVWETGLLACLDGYDGCPELDDPHDGGCAAAPHGALGVALALLGLRRRRYRSLSTRRRPTA